MTVTRILGILFLFIMANVKGQTVTLSRFLTGDASTSIRMALHSPNDTVIIDRSVNPWSLRPVRLAGIRNKTIIIEPGVHIQAEPGAFPGTSDALFTFIDSDNVTILGNENVLAMNKAEYTDGEWRHIISLRGCSNIRIKDLILKDSGGDGIYIAGSNKKTYSENIIIENVMSFNNKRQGMSIISANGVYVYNSEFSNTKGTLPGAGVDIEPNRPQDRISNIFFDKCIFKNNYNAGIKIELWKLTSASDAVSITFSDCFLQNNFHPENPRAPAEISIGAHKTDPVKGKIVFERCHVQDSSWGLLYSRKAADAFHVSFRACSAQNICRGGSTSPILLEVADYRNSSPDLGGFEFIDTFIQYESALPLLVVRGSRFGTLEHLRDLRGTLSYSGINNNNVLRYINYDPRNNIDVNLEIIKK